MTRLLHNPAAAEILGLALTSPVVVGSGLLTDQERNIRRLLAAGAGAVVTKTIHPNPAPSGSERLLHLPTGMINSTTYSRRGIDQWCAMLRRFAADRLPVIASLHADSPAELAELAAAVADTGCRALELGISCMNEDGGLTDTAERVAAYTGAVRSVTTLPFSVKLAAGERVRERVDAAVAAGADAITLSDTIAGLAVDPKTGRVLLGGTFGYSGPGIKPLVLAEIYELRRSGVQVPLMGSGGVQSAPDVAEYLSVGADAVQVYTALHRNMHDSLAGIREGFDDWLRDHGGTVAALVGRSLPKGEA
ncbi:dihydroorotate dehydrogenase [Streptomyces venezuelae]|uniref:dihydroorotate dehydrogenase n=1 Tax=Streptomyces venezuelae TaxID=54571 RepID=UPI001CC2503D|nr:dihydroorotate dehydrogenase [Streptomyces venezuelae]